VQRIWQLSKAVQAHTSNAASVLTSSWEVWRFTGKQFVHRVQRHVTGLGASRSVCLSHSLEFWQQQQKFTVARPHLNFICRVFGHRCKT
jgi:hypothetical protein